MILKLCLVSVCSFSAVSLANEICYEVSPDGSSWPKTTDLICINESAEATTITLKEQDLFDFGGNVIASW